MLRFNYSFTLLLLIFIGGCQQSSDFWNKREISIIASISLDALPELPPSPSNQYADNLQAAAFGKQLFFDVALSSNKKIACSSCHQPENFFTDGLAKARGIELTTRNTPSLFDVARNDWYYWDGRKDSLWSQALTPLEASAEMGSNRLNVLRTIGNNLSYRRQYTELFGNFPVALLRNGIPQNASPFGDTTTQNNWYRLTATQRQQINIAFSNIGKAIAAYERTLTYQTSQFDYFAAAILAGDYREAENILGVQAIAGLKLFLDESKTQCLMCHNGPLLSNGHFHNVGSGKLSGKTLDMGRYIGIQSVLIDEFNCLGIYSDADNEDCHALRFLNKDIDNSMLGAYKTPSLRNLNFTSPYFHDGRYTTLEEVILHYSQNMSSDAEIAPIHLTATEQQQLVAFLNTLSPTIKPETSQPSLATGTTNLDTASLPK